MTKQPNTQNSKYSRTRGLDALRCLPNDAIINITEASYLLGKHPETIRRWRKLSVGPRHLRHPIYPNHTEYLIGDVRAWIISRFDSFSGDPLKLLERDASETLNSSHSKS